MVVGLIDAHGDVRRLLADGIQYGAGFPVKTYLRAVIANVADGMAHDFFKVHPGAGSDFTGNDDHAGLDHGLNGNARLRVLLKNGVEDGVRDLVSDLVRVSFGDRF